MKGTWRETDLTSVSGTLIRWLRMSRNRKTGAVGWRSKNGNLLLKIAQNVLKIECGDLKTETPFFEGDHHKPMPWLRPATSK